MQSNASGTDAQAHTHIKVVALHDALNGLSHRALHFPRQDVDVLRLDHSLEKGRGGGYMTPASRLQSAPRISDLRRAIETSSRCHAYPNFVFQDVGKVVLQLRAAKVVEDLRPFGRACKAAEVGFLNFFDGPCKEAGVTIFTRVWRVEARSNCPKHQHSNGKITYQLVGKNLQRSRLANAVCTDKAASRI